MAVNDKEPAGDPAPEATTYAADASPPVVEHASGDGPVHPNSIKAATIIHPDSLPSAIIQPPGSVIWDMRSKDVARFWERFHKGAQRALAGDVTDRVINSNIFGNTGRIRLQVWGIDEWRFVFGRDKKGSGGDGNGQGDGGSGGDGGGDNSKGGQGGSGSSHNIEIELTEDAIDEILFRGLKLPRMLKKRKGETKVVGHRLSGLGPSGSRAELSPLDTMRNRFKRAIALARAHPELLSGTNRKLPTFAQVPIIRKDKRYWQFETVRQPMDQAVLFAVCDRSPSMTKDLLELAYYFFNLKFRFLRKMYENVVVVMVAHGDKKVVVCSTEHAFRNAEVDAGTGFSTVLNEVMAICRGERPHVKEGGFPPDAWNIYVDQATDGDAFEAEEIIRTMYRSLLDFGTNFITYIETHGSTIEDFFGGAIGGDWGSGGTALGHLEKDYADHIAMGRVTDRPSVVKLFVDSLSKDSERK